MRVARYAALQRLGPPILDSYHFTLCRAHGAVYGVSLRPSGQRAVTAQADMDGRCHERSPRRCVALRVRGCATDAECSVCRQFKFLTGTNPP